MNRWRCMKSRAISERGTALKPDSSTNSASTRTAGAASAEPSSLAKNGANATMANASIAALTRLIVNTVGPISRDRPCSRTMAKLTPSSAKLIAMVKTVSATVKTPKLYGSTRRATTRVTRKIADTQSAGVQRTPQRTGSDLPADQEPAARPATPRARATPRPASFGSHPWQPSETRDQDSSLRNPWDARLTPSAGESLWHPWSRPVIAILRWPPPRPGRCRRADPRCAPGRLTVGSFPARCRRRAARRGTTAGASSRRSGSPVTWRRPG